MGLIGLFRMLSGAPKFSISVLRYVKGVFGCSLMFRYVQRCYQIFLDVLRCSQMFPDVPRCSQIMCSPVFDRFSLDVLRMTSGLFLMIQFDDPQVFDDPKELSIGSMDFYNPKFYGDTSIFDGLVSYTYVLRVVRILRSALIFLL